MGQLSRAMALVKKAPRWPIALIAVCAIAAYFIVPLGYGRSAPISEIVRAINLGDVKELISGDQSITVETIDGKTLKSSKEQGADVFTVLTDLGANRGRIAAIPNIAFDTPSFVRGFATFVLYSVAVAIIALFTGLAIFGGAIAAQDQLQKKKAQSVASPPNEELPTVKWSDIAGAEDAKRALQENSRFFKTPESLRKVGGQLRKGILLVGPPGTGKTLLARAMAADVGAKFFSTSGSAFVEMYVGLGAARVRELFAKAKNESAAVVFIDEIDAIGRRRVNNLSGGSLEYDHALNQLLIELDGFEKHSNVMIIAATNRADVLDEALLRPGRFDLIIEVKVPGFEERYQLFGIHAEGKSFDESWNDDAREALARQTVGMTGAEIATVMNEAAIAAALNNSPTISRDDILTAATKISAVVKFRRLATGE